MPIALDGFVRLFVSGPEEARAKGMEYFVHISARSVEEAPAEYASIVLDSITRS